LPASYFARPRARVLKTKELTSTTCFGYRSQAVDRVFYLINPILHGWVNYFAVGNSSECFNYIEN
jgi:Group II intron, maturase-specific domain